MIPWFDIKFPEIPFPIIGKLSIHAFGILVATGILVGARLTRTRARELGLVDEMVASMVTTILVCGFLFAHIFDILAYQAYWSRPTLVELLNPTQGFSSFGGFIGAIAGLYYWCWRHKQPVMPYADSLAYGLATGWMFGRLGCFTAHDHPGIRTSFFLAVKYPEAGGFVPRFDLGLLEALWAMGVALSFAVLRRKRQPVGIYVTILTLAYAPVRFGLDFLRVSGGDFAGTADARYGGLTPAQWGCVLALMAGIGLLIWTRMNMRRQLAHSRV
jgi:phosphatidylglycerol:prolipoprotein diacylglycerol transferase